MNCARQFAVSQQILEMYEPYLIAYSVRHTAKGATWLMLALEQSLVRIALDMLETNQVSDLVLGLALLDAQLTVLKDFQVHSKVLSKEDYTTRVNEIVLDVINFLQKKFRKWKGYVPLRSKVTYRKYFQAELR